MATDGQQTTHSFLNVCLRIKAQTDQENADNAYSIINSKAFAVKTWKNEVIYNFSHVFGAEINQEEVFDMTAGSSIQQFLEGKDCLMLAYGTTNAGKTYSVQGNLHNPGIVPRTMSSIFNAIKGHIDCSPHIAPCNFSTAQVQNLREKHHIEGLRAQLLSQCRGVPPLPFPQLANCSLSFSSALSSTVSGAFDLGAGDGDVTYDEFGVTLPQGWKSSSRCSLWLSMIEVYNESIFDLLSHNKASSKVSITMDMEGRFYPAGQIEIHVNSLEEAKAVIQFGNKQRTKSSTLLNRTSSRSHCILRLRLVRADRAPGNLLNVGPQSPAAFDIEDNNVSTFMICDLAGAERTNKTGEAKGRARETAKINNALVVLGRCIKTLRRMGGSTSNRNAVVPYRESRLTMILQPLLSDPGPKHFLINISTSPNLLEETINVLNFSSVARKVIVTEQMRSVPHYQLPTQSKQLQALYQSRTTDDRISSDVIHTDASKSDDEEDIEDTATHAKPVDIESLLIQIPKETIGTQTDPMEVEIPLKHNDTIATQTEATGDEESEKKKPKLVDTGIQTDEMVEIQVVKNDTEVTILKENVMELQKALEDVKARAKEREKEIFNEFDLLEQELKDNQKEQMQIKEAQLYSLMEDRLQILRNFHEGEMSTIKAKNEELLEKLKTAEAEKDAANLAYKATSKELASLKLNLEVNRDMYEYTTSNMEKLQEQQKELIQEKNHLKGIIQKLVAENDAIREQIKQADKAVRAELEKARAELKEKENSWLIADTAVKAELEKTRAELKEKENTWLIANTSIRAEWEKARAELKEKEEAWQLERDAANLNYNADVKNLERDVKSALAQVVEMKEKLETAENNCLKYKKKNGNILSELEEKNSDLQRCKQIVEYLVDHFRPDIRQSVAGCANEELTWNQLIKEVESIPSQCAQLKKENHELKKELQLKEQDMEKFKELRDSLLTKYDRELTATKAKMEEYKRECQILTKQVLCMTPRKQDTTPQKEFKTPLTPKQQSLILGNSSNKKENHILHDEEPEVQEMTKSARRTTRTRKTPARFTTSSLKENLTLPEEEEEAVQKTANQKPRRRRLLNTLHPALDFDEPPVECDLPVTSQLSETKRKLRAKYK